MARVIRLADRIASRRGQKDTNPRKFSIEFPLTEIHIIPHEGHRTLRAYDLVDRSKKLDIERRCLNLPDGIEDPFFSGERIRTATDEVLRLASAYPDSKYEAAAAYCTTFPRYSNEEMEGHTFKFGLCHPNDITIVRLKTEEDGFPTPESILSRSFVFADDCKRDVTPVSPIELARIACAVSRNLGQMEGTTAFLAELVLPITEEPIVHDGPINVIDVQQAIGVALIEPDGVIKTFIPGMEKMGWKRSTRPGDEEKTYVRPTRSLVSPSNHPPLGAFTLLSDTAAFAIAQISQSDLLILKLLNDIYERGGRIRRWMEIMRRSSVFEGFIERYRQALEPLKEAVALTPGIMYLAVSFHFHFITMYERYKQGLPVEYAAQAFKEICKAIKAGLDVAPETKTLVKLVKDVINNLERSVAAKEIKRKDADTIIIAIGEGLEEHFYRIMKLDG